MKKAKENLDLEHNSAEIFGKKMLLSYISSGHYCVPIDRGEILVEHVCAVRLQNLNKKKRYKILLRLNRQFAHYKSNEGHLFAERYS